MEYSYPIDPDWSTEEIMQVIDFFQQVEEAYESGTSSEKVQSTYKKFKQVVPSKSEEKTLFKEFEKKSGYVPYDVVKKANQQEEGTIQLKK